ncbi:MAG: hypothetical protein ABJN14_12925 [Paracoccaceae bacterium]
MVNLTSEFQELYLKSQNGGESEAVALLKFAYSNRNLNTQDVLAAADLVKEKLDPAPDFRRYQIGRLYRLGRFYTQATEILEYLSYERGYAPAQWMLGRMVVYGEITSIDMEEAIEHLRAGQKNEHIRAPITRLIVEIREAGWAFKMIKIAILVPYIIRFRIYEDILKVKDYRMQ